MSLYSLYPPMNSDGSCPDGSYFVSCSNNGSNYVRCDYADGYSSLSSACSNASQVTCPDDISQFRPCSSTTTTLNPVMQKSNNREQQFHIFTFLGILMLIFISIKVSKL